MGIPPEFIPKFYDFSHIPPQMRDQYSGKIYNNRDRFQVKTIERVRQAITQYLADYFGVSHDQINIRSIPSESIANQRDQFAWLAIYDPETKKLYYADGRTQHNFLLRTIILQEMKKEGTEADAFTMKIISREPTATFDPNEPYAIAGLHSPKSLHALVPGWKDKIHAIFRTPLPIKNNGLSQPPS